MKKIKRRYKIAIDYFCWSYRLVDIIDKKFIYIKCNRFKKIMFIYTYLLFSLMRDTKEYKVNNLQEVIEKLCNYDYTLLKQNINIIINNINNKNNLSDAYSYYLSGVMKNLKLKENK